MQDDLDLTLAGDVAEALPYALDIAPDGDGWRVRRRWKQGLRHYLPAFWEATDAEGVRKLIAGG
ncbi:hypothetical protein BH11PSE2_BH11PSE2_13240 [soil metagenome]